VHSSKASTAFGMKTFLIVLAIVAIVLIVRFLLRQRRSARPRAVVGGDMVRCARCGLHLPVGTAVKDGADWYCSREHQRLGRGGSGA
jgi:uncharacterized protein